MAGRPTLSYRGTDRRFEKALVEYARLTGKSFGVIIKDQTRLVARNAAIRTQPYGSGKKTQEVMKTAIARDINKVYATAGEIFGKIKDSGNERLAGAFYRAMMKGRYSEARSILRRASIPERNANVLGKFDKGAAHRRYRNKRGRVKVRSSPVIIQKHTQLVRYIKQVQRRALTGKAGWWSVAKRLGSTRGISVPGAARLKAPARVTDKTKGRNPHVLFENQVPYISDILPNSEFQKAFDSQKQNLMKAVDMALKKAGRKAGFRVF